MITGLNGYAENDFFIGERVFFHAVVGPAYRPVPKWLKNGKRMLWSCFKRRFHRKFIESGLGIYLHPRGLERSRGPLLTLFLHEMVIGLDSWSVTVRPCDGSEKGW
jgi:hypothetical protein